MGCRVDKMYVTGLGYLRVDIIDDQVLRKNWVEVAHLG